LEFILASSNSDLLGELAPIKQQIASYQFVDAAHALNQFLSQRDPG